MNEQREAGQKETVKIHCGWKDTNKQTPDGELHLLDDGKPVRFFPNQGNNGLELTAVYSFQKGYANAPIEEDRDIAYMHNIKRKKVVAKK